MTFDYAQDFARLDLRKHPELYRIGRGEQGVLLVQPYKSELLPHWRFKTPEIARESARKIYEIYLRYKAAGDFVGMDMARKFLQMGFTRARRYANHKTGQKYVGPVPKEHRGRSGAWGRPVAPRVPDPVKAESAQIFYAQWQIVEADAEYQKCKQQHRERYESP